MKKIIFILLVFSSLLSSCAFHNGLTTNQNNHSTEVVLSKNNYKVVGRVQGEAQVLYVFGIGGVTRKGLVAEATANMLSNANIVGSSKAIINKTVEVRNSFFPIVQTYKVTVSGYIIEFTE